MAFIEIKNLTVEYNVTDEKGEVHAEDAISDVSLSIEKGDFVSIVGRNGSGKSTLAKTINGILAPASGEVLVDGMSTTDFSKIYEIRSKVAMVFQNPDNQIVSSIVEDDVAFGPENLGVPSAEIRKRVDEALKAVDMYEFRTKGPHHLSGGQKQRIAIAGAIAMMPECIVFDEPTAMLDPKGRAKVMDIIKSLNGRGMTVVLITHFMEEAAEADKIIVMEDGRLRDYTTPSELFSDVKAVLDAGLELPTVVDLRGRLAARGVDLDNTILTKDELIDGITKLKARRA